MYKFEYYQNSFLPEIPEQPIEEKMSFNKIKKKYYENTNTKPLAFFASYITEFDCGQHTDWWFTIKDDEYDISKLSSSKRYEITKAKKYCTTKIIDTLDYIDQIIDCYIDSVSSYDDSNRPKNFDINQLERHFTSIIESSKYRFYATFFSENHKLIGFAYVEIKDKYVKLVSQKSIPMYKKYNSNAALLDFLLNDWNGQLRNKSVIITNGSRTIKHKTNFNEYLEKYFGFRKAYAKLKVVYRFPINILVVFFKPFYKIFKNSRNQFLYNIYCLMLMDSYRDK